MITTLYIIGIIVAFKSVINASKWIQCKRLLIRYNQHVEHPPGDLPRKSQR